MTTYVIYGDVSDWYLNSSDASYANAVAGTGTKLAPTGTDSLVVGQRFTGASYFINQPFLQFDTSGVDTRTILSATLSLVRTSGFTAGSFAVYEDAWTAGDVSEYRASDAGLTARSGTIAFTTANISEALLNPSTVPRSAAYQLTLMNKNTIAPTGDETYTFRATEAPGTADDPALTIVTADPTSYAFMV